MRSGSRPLMAEEEAAGVAVVEVAVKAAARDGGNRRRVRGKGSLHLRAKVSLGGNLRRRGKDSPRGSLRRRAKVSLGGNLRRKAKVNLRDKPHRKGNRRSRRLP